MPRRQTASVAVVLALIVVAPAAAAQEARRLELDPRWLRIIEPWRYEEARRFEPGWNRGADVRAPGDVVRAPVAGRVRFVGRVAGRLVLTIDATIAGAPVVVTMTGLDRVVAARGEPVDAGVVVARGGTVHVGAYDPQRRTRYLPVVARRDGPPASGHHGAGARIAGTVVRRLADAIDGTASSRADLAELPRADHASAGGGARGSRGAASPAAAAMSAPWQDEASLEAAPEQAATRPGVALPVVAVPRTAATSDGPSAPRAWRPVQHVDAPGSPAAPRVAAIDGPLARALAPDGFLDDGAATAALRPAGDERSTTVRAGRADGGHGGPGGPAGPASHLAIAWAAAVGHGGLERAGGGRLRSTGPPTQPESGSARARVARAPGSGTVPGSQPAELLPAARVGAVDAPGSPSLETSGTAADGAGRIGGSSTSGAGRAMRRPSAVVGAVVLLLGSVALARRRRRRGRTTTPVRVHQPLPPVLPRAARGAARCVPDVAEPEPGAWPAVGSGTRSHDLQTPPAARVRSPEHA